jgi:hypothetical protein
MIKAHLYRCKAYLSMELHEKAFQKNYGSRKTTTIPIPLGWYLVGMKICQYKSTIPSPTLGLLQKNISKL